MGRCMEPRLHPFPAHLLQGSRAWIFKGICLNPIKSKGVEDLGRGVPLTSLSLDQGLSNPHTGVQV